MGDCAAVSRALPAKRHVYKTLPLPKNTADEGMFHKNRNAAGQTHGGAVLKGCALMGLRCGEPSDDKPQARVSTSYRLFAITHSAGSWLHQRDIPLSVIAESDNLDLPD